MWVTNVTSKSLMRELSVFRKDNTGSLTVFSVFLFIMILLIAGMGVDLIRYEKERVALQNSLDTAVVAASSLTQDGKSEAETIALVKEYIQKAGYDPDMVVVDPQFEIIAGNTVNRSVSANVDFKMDTMFMNMMGIDTLNGKTGSAAEEGNQLLEIVMVLDVSGSMGSNSKLENLKTAAKNFVTKVIETNGACIDPPACTLYASDRVAISIVPYNQQVYMDDELAVRLKDENMLADATVTVANNGPSFTGEIENYQTLNAASRCARFVDADFQTRDLSENLLEMSGMYSSYGNGMNTPSGNSIWCGENYPRMMLYENDMSALHLHIEGFSADGWTAIDYGMNWAVGLLDPSFEPIISGMVQDGLLPSTMETHPLAYDNPDVKKFIVLMTDGINTVHEDLKAEFKAGPTPIWYSPSLAAAGNEYNGFLVQMPNNDATQRWYVPNAPYDASDDAYRHQSDLPTDAVQWDYHQLYARFSVPDAAEYFFASSDQAAYTAHANAIEDSGGYATADTRVSAICTAAKANEEIDIYTVAFEAPPAAETLLAGCATDATYAFNVDGLEINSAFNAIATQISSLRLTQ